MSLSAPTKITVPWADSGTKNTIPVESQIGITPGAASWTDGFPPLTMTAKSAGGVPPAGPDVNGGLNAISSALQWLQAGAGYPYDSTFATAIGGYPLNALVQRSDGKGLWLNTVANNAANPENSTSNGWVPLSNNVTTSIAMTSSNVTLTALQAGAGIIYLSGTLTANLNLVFPTWRKEWLVVNDCTGSFSVTCKTASGTGVIISTGSNAIVYGDGTNINYYSGSAAQTFNVANATQSQHAVALGQFGSLLSTNGWKKIPDQNSPSGYVIYQWGSVYSANVTTTTVSFPMSFPNNCFQVIACGYNVSGGAEAFVTANSPSSLNQASFNAFYAATPGAALALAGSGQVRIQYFAIGN